MSIFYQADLAYSNSAHPQYGLELFLYCPASGHGCRERLYWRVHPGAQIDQLESFFQAIDLHYRSCAYKPR